MPSTSLTNSLKRGLQILEAFSPSCPRMKLQEVVNRTNLPKVTVLRFLRTLTALNYLSYDSETKLYSLSPKVMSLGYTALSSMDLREIATPFLEQLSESTGQNVNLGVLDGCEIVYIERIKKKQILNIDLHVGSRLTAYNSSIGQVIIAFMDTERRKQLVMELLQNPEIAKNIGPDGEILYKKLDEIRIQGYAINDESYIKGLRAIGVPVFNHRGIVDAGINIPVFAHIVSLEELIQKYLPPLIETASHISNARGFFDSNNKAFLNRTPNGKRGFL